jgi:hypothetical protein
MLIRAALASLLLITVPLSQSNEDPIVTYSRRLAATMKPVQPTAGYVPDEATAAAIATAVLTPIYGKAMIDGEKPWRIGLKDGVWTVVGSVPQGALGGSAIVQIDKKTGAITFLSHTM